MRTGALDSHTEVRRRAVRPADLPFLRALYSDAHIELAVLPPDTRFVLVDMQFRAERSQWRTQFPAATDQVLSVDGVDVGRLLTDCTAEAVRVVDLSVSLGRRGEGIASAALAGVVGDADAARRRVWLTVRSGNAPARSLCERAGFVVCADEDGYLTMEHTA